jgi:hypothetical protein
MSTELRVEVFSFNVEGVSSVFPYGRDFILSVISWGQFLTEYVGLWQSARYVRPKGVCKWCCIVKVMVAKRVHVLILCVQGVDTVRMMVTEDRVRARERVRGVVSTSEVWITAVFL